MNTPCTSTRPHKAQRRRGPVTWTSAADAIPARDPDAEPHTCLQTGPSVLGGAVGVGLPAGCRGLTRVVATWRTREHVVNTLYLSRTMKKRLTK